MGIKYTSERILDMLGQAHGNKYSYPKGTPTHRKRDKMEIVCPSHGIFYQDIYNHLSGQGCAICALNEQSIRLKSTTDEFMAKARNIHGDKYDYSRVNYIGKDVKIEITCKYHGKFMQSPIHHIRGSGCPACAGVSKSNTKDFIEKSKVVHKNAYIYTNTEYINAKKKVEIICPKHGSLFIRPNDHLSGQGCGKCSTKVSKVETEFLDELRIVKENRQVAIGKYTVDGIDRDGKIIYEFLGDFWHGNLMILDENDVNPVNNKSYFELHNSTMLRFDDLIDYGYVVKYVWENQWRKWKKTKIGPIPLLEHIKTNKKCLDFYNSQIDEKEIEFFVDED